MSASGGVACIHLSMDDALSRSMRRPVFLHSLAICINFPGACPHLRVPGIAFMPLMDVSHEDMQQYGELAHLLLHRRCNAGSTYVAEVNQLQHAFRGTLSTREGHFQPTDLGRRPCFKRPPVRGPDGLSALCVCRHIFLFARMLVIGASYIFSDC